MARHYHHPTDIPRSKVIRSVDWLGDLMRINDENAIGDSHAMTWAADDQIYMGTGDPQSYVNEQGEHVRCHYGTEHALGWDKTDAHKWRIYEQTTGTVVERLRGGPEDMELDRINDLPGIRGWGGSGAKPTGMISVDGVLYMAMQNMLGWKPPHFGTRCQHGSDATIICSRDFGKTWEPDIEPIMRDFVDEEFVGVHQACYAAVRNEEWKSPWYERGSFRGWRPMFPGDWFGTPAFVQHGKDNQDAVDGYVYAVSSDQFDNGTNLRVGRVPKEKILAASAWEFACYQPDGTVGWTDDLYKSEPMLEIYRHISAPEMVYVPALKKYLLLTWAHHSDFNPNDGSELTILEADHPWGPFSLVFYEWMWYKQEAGGYCPRLPMKWFDPATLTGYMEWAGNYFTASTAPYYAPSVRKFRFVVDEHALREHLKK